MGEEFRLFNDVKLDSSPNEILEKIKLLKTVSAPEYEYLKVLLYKNLFSKIPVVMSIIPKGDYLYRTVSINREDLTIGRKKYLSYRPKELTYPFFNRCTEPEGRHFYCSTTRHLSMGESSYFISEGSDPDTVFKKESELLEVGMWKVTQDIFVADLRYGDFTHSGTESKQSEIKHKYQQFSNDKYVIDFFEFINKTFELPVKAKNHLNYWLTACYSHYLFEERFLPQKNWGSMNKLNFGSETQINGILFHSVKGIQTEPPMEGYNLALEIDLIDNQSLSLIKAGIFESKRISQTEFMFDRLIKINTDITGQSWYYQDAFERDKL